MIKRYFSNRDNRIRISVFIVTMLIACVPLINRYCINGHDLEYHLLRIESLKEGILLGKPFLRVNALYFGGAGYASSMFYPDFLLYIPAILRVIGISINSSYHIFIALTFILCYLSTYFCCKGITKSSYAGMLSAILLTLCQYHLDDVYIRSAVGEYTAFIFIPFVVYGLYNLINEKFNKPLVLALGFGGLLLCHTNSFVMCVVFGAIIIIVNIKKLIVEKQLIIKFIMTTLLVMAITAFYWIPMLEQFMNTSFYVSIPWMNPKDEAVYFSRIFTSLFPSMGCILILLCIPRIFIKKNESTKEVIKYADILMLAGVLFIIFASNIIPWDRLGKYLSFIQFPWRLFILSSVLLAMAAGMIFAVIFNTSDNMSEFLSGNTNISDIIICFVLIVCGISGFNTIQSAEISYYDYSNDYYTYKPYTANVIGGEWLPISVVNTDELVDNSEHMIDNNGNEIDFSRVKTSIVADINEKVDYIDVPFIYYLGYASKINMDDGLIKELRVTNEGYNGLCRVYLDGNTTGKLTVYYKGTILQKVSSVISMLTVVALAVVKIRKRREKDTSMEGKNE